MKWFVSSSEFAASHDSKFNTRQMANVFARLNSEIRRRIVNRWKKEIGLSPARRETKFQLHSMAWKTFACDICCKCVSAICYMVLQMTFNTLKPSVDCNIQHYCNKSHWWSCVAVTRAWFPGYATARDPAFTTAQMTKLFNKINFEIRQRLDKRKKSGGRILFKFAHVSNGASLCMASLCTLSPGLDMTLHADDRCM